MAAKPLSRETIEAAYSLYLKEGSVAKAARTMGVPEATFKYWIYQKKKEAPLDRPSPQPTTEFTVMTLPDDDIDIEELVELRIKQFGKKKEFEEASKLIPVNVKIKGAIGILHFGDPHVDDDGTDLATLREHSDLTKQEGVWGANVGDTTNNWIGRLARLYANQSTSAAQAWKLAEWFINRTRWLYMIGGNHDCHDTQTEALTRRGWLPYDQIKDDDEVLSFNTETGSAEWHPILKRIIREHDGEMISVSTQSINYNVTPNHRILHRDRDWKRDWRDWKYATADSLPSRVAIPVSGNSINSEYQLSDDQIALAGWVLTDGSISWQGNSPRVTLYQSKDGSEIVRLLDAIGLEYRHSVRERKTAAICGRALISAPMPSHEWTLTADSSRKVLEFLPEKNKLPEWANKLSSRQFQVLLDALIAGDGTWDGVNPESKSVGVLHGTKEFLDSVQSVSIQHGWYSRISIAREKDTHLNLCKRETIQFETKSATKKTQYKGTVWCLTVPLSNFMVRRNGAAHFSGNCWAGSADPIKWVARQNETLYKPSECRVDLRFPNGRSVIVNARHDFAGSSQWNPAHAQMKAAQMGYRDHIMISGHKHTSGYGIIKDPNGGKVCHAVQVASYKIYDTYAKERGFRDQTVSPACMTIIDPALSEDHPDMVKVFWDPKEGAEFLKWKRRK